MNKILASPLTEVLSRLANIFYFIGSDGINTIAANLLAPLNTLIEEVDDLFPLAIRIDVAAEQILTTYLGVEHEGVPAGITVNVAGADLAKLINNLIKEIKIDDTTTIKLSLDLNWTAIAAKMAKKDADGKILTTGTKQVYNLGTVQNADKADLVNLTGDAGNALVTLLDTVLTANNCKNIYNLVTGLLKDLDPTLKGVIEELIGSPESIKGIVAAVVLILTGEYEVAELNYIFKYLGTLTLSRTKDAETAVESLDRVLIKAVPVIIELLAKDVTDENNFLYKLYNGTDKNATLDNVVNYLLNDFLFTDDMMATITGALLGILKSLGSDITGILKDILGIDLAPKAFAAATGNAQLKAYVGNAATWADVVAAKTDKDGNLAPVFSGVNSKDAFVGAILNMLKPLEKVLAFILTGEDLVVTIEKDGEKAALTLKGGNAYESAIVPLLYQGLGLEEIISGTNKATVTSAAKAETANEAIGAVVDALLVDLVGAVKSAPLSTILTAVANLAFFIANNDVAVVIQNLAAPVLAIVDALGGVISRAQLDVLLENLIKVKLPNGKKLNLTNIINIAGDNGQILIDLINGLLPNIEIKDKDGNVVQTINALPADFFLNLAKAAVRNEKGNAFTGSEGTNVTKWTTDNGSAIMYVLTTVLTTDFLNILCDAIGIEEKTEDGKDNMVYGIITSLAGSSDAVIDLILMLLNRYLVEYKGYNQPVIDKTKVNYKSEADHQQFNQVVSNLDGLIPVIFELIPSINADNLGDLVYPLFVKNDIANLLVSAVAKLLAGLPVETITMIEGLVSDLASIKNTADGKAFSIAPATFKNGKFGSNLAAYIGNAQTWNDVWMNHSEVVDGERVATAYEWGIDDVDDFINLICDFLAPLDCVLTLLTQGGMVRADFEKNKKFTGKTLAVLDEIAISGGSGYNYAIIPLLELLGIEADTQEEYNKAVEANNGSALYPVLKAIFGRVDEILNAPISNVLEMLPNLCYALATGSVSTIVENLIAPVNHVIAAVDEIFPIAIPIDIGALINGGTLDTFIGKEHPGIDAGITFKLDGNDISKLLEDVIAGINIGGATLKVDLDWLALAQAAGADADGNGKVDFNGSAMNGKWDIYNGAAYKNLKADLGDTFITLIKTVLTKENWATLKTALNINLGDFDETVNGIVEDPTQIISLIANLLATEVSYIPVQNQVIDPNGFNYSSYGFLTETNADLIANNIDGLINDILEIANVNGAKTVKELVGTLLTNDLVSNLVGSITGLLGGDSVGPILGTIASLTTGEDPILVVYDEKGNVENLNLDLTIEGYAKAYASYKNANEEFAARLAVAKTWNDVDTTGIKWGVNGTVTSFANAFASILNPLNCVLELLLKGEGKTLGVLPGKNADGSYTRDENGMPKCVANIKGGNGYDYAIIPLLEAFGLESYQVLTQTAYAKKTDADPSQTLGYILERIGFFADDLLKKPVDKLLEILPNVGYFLSNEGFYLTVRNLIAPVIGIVNTIASVIPEVGAIFDMLDVAKLLHSIKIPVLSDEAGNPTLVLTIPEINFEELASIGVDAIEVSTSRSEKANSFKKAITDPEHYVDNYPTGYESYISNGNKLTQTYIVSDKGDTLTWLFTFVANMFSDATNREALVQCLVKFFKLNSGAEQTVRYAIDRLFAAGDDYAVPDIIVTALFQALGVAVVVDAMYQPEFKSIQTIFEDLFKGIANGSGCAYGSIARAMEDLTGIWEETIGPDEDHEEAVGEAEESLNWFQKIIKKIKDFFAKIFGIFG